MYCSIMMSYLAISCVSRKVRQEELGGNFQRVQTARPCLGLAVKSPWLEPGRPSSALKVNGPRKRSSHLV